MDSTLCLAQDPDADALLADSPLALLLGMLLDQQIPMEKAFKGPKEIADRLIRTFTRDASGRRPVYGDTTKFQEDPHWRDLLLFYEYFHGDTGQGVGASHQTGWTGVVARAMHLFATTSAAEVEAIGKQASAR